MSYYEAFISLEAYPDAVFTQKEEIIWIIIDDLKEMRGDEWVFHVLQGL